MCIKKHKIAIIGAGRLGLCLAVNLDRAGFTVLAVDKDSKRVDEINNKELKTIEPNLNEFLKSTTTLSASSSVENLIAEKCTVLFICLPTPSKEDGSFSIDFIEEICDELILKGIRQNSVELIINSTVMPGDCDKIERKMKPYNYNVSYNPEFIAQGSIIKDQLYPDQILMGSNHENSINLIKEIYDNMCLNKPKYSLMKLVEAEITKLAVNCFLTTKIAFANAIGDITKSFSCNETNVLEAIGADSRIGNRFLKYGYGYGGPCLPRDNRALKASALTKNIKLHLSEATDLANNEHLHFQKAEILKQFKGQDEIIFEDVTYKSNSNIIEESQKLALAVLLANDGKKVTIKDRKEVIKQVKKEFGNLFQYIII